MNNEQKQLAIWSAILALVFNIPLMALIAIWSVILFFTIGDIKSFCTVLKAAGLTVIVWFIGFILAYYIIY